MTRSDGTQTYYLRGRNFKPLPGMVVVHNHIMHSVHTGLGERGFRAWQQTRTGKLVKCRCGWWGIEHYRVRGLGSGKCHTDEQIMAEIRKEFPGFAANG